ncbi:uncharacterized domain 1-containing protein [Tardiphaga sp. OK246]|uniref:PaaI family thioesterase n=1 Tax=Tardiphaga sp. OK246 TaxID=1855307 RepID=UPI000B70C4A6|nr:PaaI family thioesterase [Tardiphaga sp. OK246]SNT32644.1 uncharacterized domain 1-containing protein [Tardiphaga sp. OK246]
MTDQLLHMLTASIETSPLIRFMGLEIQSVDLNLGRVIVLMPKRGELMRTEGDDMFHGGPIAALIDTTGDLAIALHAGGIVPTINFSVDFLRPARGAFLKAVATSRKNGRTVGIADVDVFDSGGKLCAIGRGCYSAIKG